MRYDTASAVPPEVLKLPAQAAAIWRAAYNAHHAKHPDDETGCFRAAWSAVKAAGYGKNDAGKWVKTGGAR